MDVWEADAWADEIFSRAGVDQEREFRPSDVAKGLGLTVYQGRGLKLPGHAALASWNGQRYIALRDGLSVEKARFAVLHELAEFVLAGAHDESIEDACNAIAAALAMPHRRFSAAVQELGDAPAELAGMFHVTPTAAALRIGEVTRVPLVALTPSWHWVRGREWGWPGETELRRIAKAGHPAIKKISLEPRRVALVVDRFEAA